MISVLSAGLKAAGKVAGAVLKGSSDVARQGLEATGGIVATPFVHVMNLAHGAGGQVLNLPGGMVQTMHAPAAAVAQHHADALSTLVLPAAPMAASPGVKDPGLAGL